MFKVGDRVRCVKITQGYYDHPPVIGRVYKVTGNAADGTLLFKWFMGFHGEDSLSYYEGDFLLESSINLGNCGKFAKSSYV